MISRFSSLLYEALRTGLWLPKISPHYKSDNNDRYCRSLKSRFPHPVGSGVGVGAGGGVVGGGMGDGTGTGCCDRAWSSFVPSGLPNPVQASHPEPAL